MKYKPEPAFPTPVALGQYGCVHSDEKGMTLRDYFAAKAMQGDMAYESFNTNATSERLSAFAALYYRMADAMISERTKPLREEQNQVG